VSLLSEAPDGMILEQSCRLSTSLPMTANRFQASVNAVFQALVSPSANSFHFFCVCHALALHSPEDTLKQLTSVLFAKPLSLCKLYGAVPSNVSW
jgi:hypothetical protein